MSVTTSRDLLAAMEAMIASDPSRVERVAAREQAHVLAEQIYALRQERNLTQVEFASQIGVSESTIVRLENAESDAPSLSTLRKLAAALGVELHVEFRKPGEARAA